MVGNGRADHFHTPDLAVFDEECFRYEDARRPIESAERVLLPCGENSRVDGALVKNHVRPHDTALLINERSTPGLADSVAIGVLTAAAVFQSVDDPNDVTVTHDFATAEAAKAFTGSSELRSAMENAGVAAPPTIWFLNEA